jgi:hypothetical protein
MARIRSIKPEFPQSESMGNVSRDARLLFVMLWPVCDDHGRTRAASRMLASTLFPYDDDAPGLIEGWLSELEREGCIRRYVVDGSTYLEIHNWLKHQKIDKPSKPVFPEPPRALSNTREDSWLEGKGREGKGEDFPTPSGGEPPTAAVGAQTAAPPPAEPTPAAVDPIKALFDRGVLLLTTAGSKPDAARSLLGKLRKEHGDIAVMAALDRADAERPSDPVPWLLKTAAACSKTGGSHTGLSAKDYSAGVSSSGRLL